MGGIKLDWRSCAVGGAQLADEKLIGSPILPAFSVQLSDLSIAQSVSITANAMTENRLLLRSQKSPVAQRRQNGPLFLAHSNR